MSKGSVAEKNGRMAKYLEENGIRRTHGACPMCHKVVSLKALYNHIISCR
jgi:hypothetical protein